MERRDESRLNAVLHPYLHFQEGELRLRGRTNVLRRLAELPPPAAPERVELRDGRSIAGLGLVA